MKKTIFVLACFLMFGFVPIINSASTIPHIQTPNFSGLPVYKVLRVVDGDTLTATNGSDEIKIRLIGVDTPETVHPRKPVEEYGIEASRFLKNLLKGESPKLFTEDRLLPPSSPMTAIRSLPNMMAATHYCVNSSTAPASTKRSA